MKSIEFAVRGDHITLGQLLKAAGIVDSGADVKRYLEMAAITVNGEPENRRGRKLRSGDVIVAESKIEIRLTQ